MDFPSTLTSWSRRRDPTSVRVGTGHSRPLQQPPPGDRRSRPLPPAWKPGRLQLEHLRALELIQRFPSVVHPAYCRTVLPKATTSKVLPGWQLAAREPRSAFDEYAKATTREIPVVVLEPQ